MIRVLTDFYMIYYGFVAILKFFSFKFKASKALELKVKECFVVGFLSIISFMTQEVIIYRTPSPRISS